MAERKISFNNIPAEEQSERGKRILHEKAAWWSPMIEEKFKMDERHRALKRYRSGAPIPHATPVTEIQEHVPFVASSPASSQEQRTAGDADIARDKSVTIVDISNAEQRDVPEAAAQPTPEEEKLVKIGKAREIISDNLFLTESQRDIVGRLLTIHAEGRKITHEDYQAMMDLLPQKNRSRLTREIGKIRSTLTRTGTGLEIVGIVDPKRGYPHIQIDVSNLREPATTADSLAASTTNRKEHMRFTRIRSAEEIALHRSELTEKLIAGLTYDQIATEWKISRETVMGDIRAVQREAVQAVLKAAAAKKGVRVDNLGLQEKDAALEAAWKKFREEHLKPLQDEIDGLPRYSQERSAAVKRVQNMRKHPTLTGLRAALYKIEKEMDKRRKENEGVGNVSESEQAKGGGVHLGSDGPPQFHKGEPRTQFPDAGPGQGMLRLQSQHIPGRWNNAFDER